MKPAYGSILRRVGLVIELAFIVALVRQGDEPRMVAGIAVRHLLIAGVALGFILWGVGLALVLHAARQLRE